MSSKGVAAGYGTVQTPRTGFRDEHANVAGPSSGPSISPSVEEDDDKRIPEVKHGNAITRVFYAYRGAFLILLAEFLMSVMNVVARYLQTSLPPERKLHPFHVMFWRMSVTCSCCLVWGFYNRIPEFPFGKRELWPILLLRAGSGFVGISCFYGRFAMTYLARCGVGVYVIGC